MIRLTFATRLPDIAFKRVLRSLRLGTEVKAEDLPGSLALHNNASRRSILLAGGIGIAPFDSTVRWAAHRELRHRVLRSGAFAGTHSFASRFENGASTYVGEPLVFGGF